jgi:hypothetical protein
MDAHKVAAVYVGELFVAMRDRVDSFVALDLGIFVLAKSRYLRE